MGPNTREKKAVRRDGKTDRRFKSQSALFDVYVGRARKVPKSRAPRLSCDAGGLTNAPSDCRRPAVFTLQGSFVSAFFEDTRAGPGRRGVKRIMRDICLVYDLVLMVVVA